MEKPFAFPRVYELSRPSLRSTRQIGYCHFEGRGLEKKDESVTLCHPTRLVPSNSTRLSTHASSGQRCLPGRKGSLLRTMFTAGKATGSMNVWPQRILDQTRRSFTTTHLSGNCASSLAKPKVQSLTMPLTRGHQYLSSAAMPLL
jgi:hypothetical protein